MQGLFARFCGKEMRKTLVAEALWVARLSLPGY